MLSPFTLSHIRLTGPGWCLEVRIVSCSIVAGGSGGKNLPFAAKVMIFAEVSHSFKPDLVAMESSPIDAIADIDDFVDKPPVRDEEVGVYAGQGFRSSGREHDVLSDRDGQRTWGLACQFAGSESDR
jgi:hypothetical protein